MTRATEKRLAEKAVKNLSKKKEKENDKPKTNQVPETKSFAPKGFQFKAPAGLKVFPLEQPKQQPLNEDLLSWKTPDAKKRRNLKKTHIDSPQKLVSKNKNEKKTLTESAKKTISKIESGPIHKDLLTKSVSKKKDAATPGKDTKVKYRGLFGRATARKIKMMEYDNGEEGNGTEAEEKIISDVQEPEVTRKSLRSSTKAAKVFFLNGKKFQS